MSTAINDIADLVRILHERPDWLETVRNIIAGEEMLSLPQELAKFVQATNENFRLVHERLNRLEADMTEVKSDVSELKTGQAETNRRLDRLEGRFSNFEGSDYERRARNRVLNAALYHFNLNNPVIAMTQDGQSAPELNGGIHRAIRAGRISWEQAQDFCETDIVIADQDGVHVLIEASITADDDDIERAVRRADVLATAISATVMPAVATANIAQPQRALAEARGVTLFTIRQR